MTQSCLECPCCLTHARFESTYIVDEMSCTDIYNSFVCKYNFPPCYLHHRSHSTSLYRGLSAALTGMQSKRAMLRHVHRIRWPATNYSKEAFEGVALILLSDRGWWRLSSRCLLLLLVGMAEHGGIADGGEVDGSRPWHAALLLLSVTGSRSSSLRPSNRWVE